jgi:small subunit ribosomal protein S8
MSMQDPISDMLTRIRNAQRAAKKMVSIPASKVKAAICAVLQEEGFIESFQLTDAANREIEVKLKYHEEAPVIELIKRASRPGLRLYKGAKDLPKTRAGFGITVISTSQGVMTDEKARALGLGGELLCFVA